MNLRSRIKDRKDAHEMQKGISRVGQKVGKLGKDLLENRLLLQEGIIFQGGVLFAPSLRI